MPRYIDADIAYDLLCDGYDLDDVPTADVAPVVHAHWIEKEQVAKYATRFPKIYSMLMYCSNCGQSNGRRISNYCPRCGAKMDEEVV